MSTHNICFRGEIRKIFTGYPPLSRPMIYLFNINSRNEVGGFDSKPEQEIFKVSYSDRSVSMAAILKIFLELLLN